jgi:phospholipase/carboxylesterase
MTRGLDLFRNCNGGFFRMAQYRFVALILAAIAIASALGLNAAFARDSSLCAPKDPSNIAAGASIEPCLAKPGAEATDTQKPPVVQDDAAAAPTPVIAGPITHTPHFIYRLLRPETPSGETIVLLHGSGGDEASLFKLAQRISPNATLLGVRGRVVQKGLKRWYARVTPTEFDQADIRKEAKAFVAFLKDRMLAEKLDLERTVFIGYSNGANLIAAVSLLYPDLVQRAVLLRAMPVLDQAPATDLKGAHFLIVAGKLDDVYAPFSPVLEALLRGRGAIVDSGVVATDHYLGDEDIKVVSDWLSAPKAMAGGTSQ